ncbi:MAG: hypothetical protein FJ037_04215 [Chloroflexi bacterium]|nr:hypothetical protein [Chloroflexota bacterium]
MNTRLRWAVASAVVLALSLAACDSESDTPASTSTPAPAATASPAASTPTSTATPTATAAAVSPTGYKDATYEIAGKPVTLKNGLSEVEAAPGSASKITTRYFGNEAQVDLNGDGLVDVAFLLTQSTGGSGTFYYSVVALRTADGWKGTNAILLGDRIAPQTTNIKDGKVIVNYADRNPGEPMTTRPSLGVSRYLSVVDGRLTE